MTMTKAEPKRWKAVIWYRADAGLIDIEHAIDELEELHDIVECGPSFYAIDRIEIRYAFPEDKKTIVEGFELAVLKSAAGQPQPKQRS